MRSQAGTDAAAPAHATDTQSAEELQRQENVALAALPYVLLVTCSVITALHPMPVHVPTVLGLMLVAAAWVAWFYTLHPQWHRRGVVMGVYYAGLMVLAATLVVLAPWFGIFALIGYVHAFECLRGLWRYVGGAATSMIMAVTYMGGLSRIDAGDWWLWAAISLIGTVLGGAAMYFTEQWLRRSEWQDRALTRLHEANGQLQSALEENAALHAQLLVQARQAGVLDERQRMAREIHDTLAQHLAGILTQLQAAEQAPARAPEAREHMTKAIDLAREGLTEARRTVHAVSAGVLAGAHLAEAIEDAADSFAAEHNLQAALTVTGDPRPMHADVDVALLRVAQEALANVAKHARARRVQLTLSYMEDLVTLDIRDDGVGFDPVAMREQVSTDSGFGLTGMRQRVQRLSGRLVIESQPGEGTALSASVPAILAGEGA